MEAGQKDPGALKTIGELSQELGIAQHILRYWETKFPQLRPMQRAGNRRYYRPNDVELARTINRLLNEQGYTVRGVQKLLRNGGGSAQLTPASDPSPSNSEDGPAVAVDSGEQVNSGVDVFRLISLRDRLVDALRS